MSYGERLEEAMKRAGVSRRELAEHLGISVQAVGQVLLGDTKAMDAVSHTRTFMFLGCDPLWLATGTRAGPGTAPMRVQEPGAGYAAAAALLEQIDWTAVRALKRDDLLRLEGAWLVAAAQLGHAIGKRAAA